MKTLKRNRSFALLALSALAIGVLVGCNPDDPVVVPPTPDTGLTDTPEQDITLSSQYLVTSRDSTYFSPHLVSSVDAEGNPTYLSAKSDAIVTSGTVAHLYAYGVPEGYSLGVTVIGPDGSSVDGIVSADGTVTAPAVNSETTYQVHLFGVAPDASKTIRKELELTVVPDGTLANGDYFDFSSYDTEQRTILTAEGEKYLIENGLAPITYMEDASYQLYSSRLHTPFLDENYYVPGYGFGILDYGSIDAPLDAELTERFKWYLHDQLDASSDLGDFNYLASNSNAVSTLYSYVSQYYFNTFVNEEGNGYSYQYGLSRLAEPEAVNPDEHGASDTWKVYLRVGGDVANEATGVTPGLNYRIDTNDSTLAQYDKTPIKLEDYLTPFKLLATQSIGYFRGSEQAAESTANRQIKGFAEFYAESAQATDIPSDEEFMSKVGVKLDHTDNSITITFNGKITPDYAEYQLNGLWCNPINESFVRQLGNGDIIAGAKSYGRNRTEGNLTPKDTMLSVGPYYTTYYESKKTIAFAKNEDWPIKQDMYGRDLYQLQGVHLNVNTNLTSNPNAYIEAFEAGTTDYSNIPADYWDKYLTDPRKKEVAGSGNLQWFINTWDKAWYDQNFGGDWEVKPILSNDNFYKGLMIGIDRQALADYYHYAPGINLQEPVNKVSPKADVAYNDSDEHLQVLEECYGSAFDDLSLWRNNAADYFELAIQEELTAGHYELGTEDNPTVVTFQMINTDAANSVYRETQIFQNWEDAFNLAVTSHVNAEGVNDWVGPTNKPLIKLDVTSHRVSSSLDDTSLQNAILYEGVKAGNYDGQCVYYVSGNGLDTFNNLDKYMSNDQSGFTLNFGQDTAIPSKELYYEGKYWSFDALWKAGNGGVLLDDQGFEQPFISEDFANSVEESGNAEEGLSLTFPFEALDGYVSNLHFYLPMNVNGSIEYVEVTPVDNGDGTITVTYPAGTLPKADEALGNPAYAGNYYVEISIDYDLTINGKTTTNTYTIGGYLWSF